MSVGAEFDSPIPEPCTCHVPCTCGSQAATIASLKAALEEAERALTEQVERVEIVEEWADKLAYAIAPQEDIGEHSNMNNPWLNAYEYVTSVPRTITALQARLLEVEGERDAAVALLERSKAALIETREMVVEWAGYASDYFKEKWDLEGDLAKIDRFVAVLVAALNGEGA